MVESLSPMLPHVANETSIQYGNKNSGIPPKELSDSRAPEILDEEPDLDAGEGLVSTESIRTYLNELGKVALLTAEQEIDLSKAIERGLLASEVLRVLTAIDPDAARQKLYESAVAPSLVYFKATEEYGSIDEQKSAKNKKRTIKPEEQARLEKLAQENARELLDIVAALNPPY